MIIDLPGGRRLTVRPTTGADVDGLRRLYERLGPDDRHRRFFSAYRPPPEVVRRMATVAERGGVSLVVTVTSPAGDEEIVAEAGCSLLDDGDGELAITVDRRWRGWLGPLLLDALLSAAAARGIPNLEADVLVTNPPMLALARSRGAVTMGRPDWTVVRLLIGTGGGTPTWPPRAVGGRLLVEGGGGRWQGEEQARKAGLQVLVCPGPAGRRPPCNAFRGPVPCPLAAGADTIVVALPPRSPEARALMAAHPSLAPGVPVCTEASQVRLVPRRAVRGPSALCASAAGREYGTEGIPVSAGGPSEEVSPPTR